MALPPTGSQITMSQIRNYFGSATTPITMSGLGTYRGISVGNNNCYEYYIWRPRNINNGAYYENIIRSIKRRLITAIY